MKKLPALLLVLAMTLTACSIRPATEEKPSGAVATYTYNTYATALGTNWNPHTRESNADGEILDYITSPFVSMSVLDSENGVYQWVYEMALSINDVTGQHPEDLRKYAVELPQEQTPEETLAGYVFEIALNPAARWQNGEPITADDYIYSMEQLLSPQMKNYRANLYISGESAVAGGHDYYYSDGSVPFDTVGLYKVDDHTIRYVTRSYIDLNYFLTSCTSNWLVYEPLYEAGKDTSGELVTTNYGTSVATTMAYGPYKLTSVQTDRQMVFLQNENWYGYEHAEDGTLVSYTDYLVDGQPRQRYQTTKIVIDVMDESAAKQAFLKGALSVWSPSAEELVSYALSDRLYRADETYTVSLFFNTNVDALKEMDRSKGNTNCVVLSHPDFRKALSLAVDREEFAGATPGYKPVYALMNDLYFYDVYNDPTSSYRGSDAAMQAICELYGVSYGEGMAYATLREAYDSISGYNLTEAKELMQSACEELTATGLYDPGEDIHIRIGWAKGALTAADTNQAALLGKYLNAAADGSSFGTITLEPIGNINDRYDDVPAGEYAIGYGAWGGAAFYPFRNLQVYCDTDQYEINEAACWDPAAETLTLNVDGAEVTKTWKDWSGALIGTGDYASADNELKLEITAQLERRFLEKYYRIPLAATTVCELLSYKASYYTDEYNIMYGFGGLELMNYHYSDEEWNSFVASQGGALSYE